MGVLWGIPYLLIKVAVEDFSPAALVFCRTGIGAVLLVPIALARHQLWPVFARWRALLAFTVAELAIPWVLLSEAEEKLPSSVSGLLVAAVPLVGALLIWIVGRRGHDDALGARGLLGLVVGFVGVAVLVGFDLSGADGPSAALVGVVVIGYALGPLIQHRALSDLPALGVVAASLSICAIIYAPFAFSELPAAVPPARVVASVVVLGVVCTAAAFIVFFALIAEAGPVRATVVTYVNPAVALVLGVAFLHEHFGVATAAGFVLILGGSVLSATRNSGARSASRGQRVGESTG
jgi:drug/metabolite transporter (DMT)-like permease